MEGAYLLVLVLGLGSFWFGSHLAACGGTLRGQRLMDAIFALPLCLIPDSPAVTQKGTCIWHDFCDCHPEDTARLLGSGGQQS